MELASSIAFRYLFFVFSFILSPFFLVIPRWVCARRSVDRMFGSTVADTKETVLRNRKLKHIVVNIAFCDCNRPSQVTLAWYAKTC